MPHAHRRYLTSCRAQGWFQFKGCFRRLISHPTDVVLQFPPTTCAVSTDGQAARRQEDEIERACERMPDKARSRGQCGHGVGGGKQKGEALAPVSEDERRERQRKRERSREQQREQEREGRQGRDERIGREEGGKEGEARIRKGGKEGESTREERKRNRKRARDCRKHAATSRQCRAARKPPEGTSNITWLKMMKGHAIIWSPATER